MSALASRLQPFAPYALALLRIAAALIFLMHGSQKVLGWPAPPASGMPAVLSLYWIGGIMELVGGVLLVLGLFTRPVAFLVSGEMAYAYWFMHAPRNVYPLLNGGDAAILYCFVFFYLVFAGPGAWALDNRRS